MTTTPPRIAEGPLAAGPRTPALVKEQIAKLPQWIRVGGSSLRIRAYAHDDLMKEDTFGHFYSARQEIALSDGIPSMAMLGEVFIHEVLHAIWWCYRLRGQSVLSPHAEAPAQDIEETIVDVTGSALWQIMRDNEWFLPWIIDCMRFEHSPMSKFAPMQWAAQEAMRSKPGEPVEDTPDEPYDAGIPVSGPESLEDM